MQVIPVLDAVKFEKIMEGGTTHPWQVIVDTPNGYESYVVKIYKSSTQHFDDPVRNDVLSNVIARGFELSVPHFAFINFTNEFISTLEPNEKAQLEDSPSKPKFGTKLINPNLPFSKAFKNSDLEVYNIESIFAFDNLILNVDRRENKPNIILTEDTYYLIDHEHTLHLQEGDKKINTFLARSIYNRHLFYNHLLKLSKKGKLEGFNVFEELLRTFNTNSLQPYINDLNLAGYNTSTCFRVINYLRHIKNNSLEFINHIREITSNE